ncbi:MAG: thioredoxin family protein [Candidatus Hydrothermarchaeales archaeon]
MKTKKVLTIIALIALLSFVYYAVNVTPVISDQNYTYLSGFTWYNSYEKGAVVAKELNKPMFVYFWTIWCTYCEKMQVEVFPYEPTAKIMREDFVLIAVDMDVNREDANRFKVQAPPYELFLTPEGERITAIPGYVPEEEFYRVIKEIRDFYYGGK